MRTDEKRLDLKRWSGKKTQKPMTIVSAIICKNAIVIASDSRTTKEDNTIRDDTKKIHLVYLKEHFGFLVGQSGNDDLGARAVEIIADLY
jgi:20S proteasome alpha/beta subunit